MSDWITTNQTKLNKIFARVNSKMKLDHDNPNPIKYHIQSGFVALACYAIIASRT